MFIKNLNNFAQIFIFHFLNIFCKLFLTLNPAENSYFHKLKFHMFANFSESFSSRPLYFARRLIKSVSQNYQKNPAPWPGNSSHVCIAILAKRKPLQL